MFCVSFLPIQRHDKVKYILHGQDEIQLQCVHVVFDKLYIQRISLFIPWDQMMNTNCCIATSLIVQNIVPLNDNYFGNNIVSRDVCRQQFVFEWQSYMFIAAWIDWILHSIPTFTPTFHCSTKLWLTFPVLSNSDSL